jgi:PEP-CTERM motif
MALGSVHHKGRIPQERMMRLRITLAAILFAGLVQASFAGIVTNGSFSISGTVYVTDAAGRVTPGGTCAVGVQCIFWQSGATTTLNKADISTSGLPSGSGVGLIPTTISGNDAANISNLANPPNIVDGVGFTNQTFLTFNNGSITTALMLNYIAAGIYSPAGCGGSPAIGQNCTTPGSLFNFVNNAGNVGPQATATWVFDGVTSGNPNPQEIWTGNFSSQFSVPFQTVLANLTTNGFVANTYSGTITLSPNPAPEPGSLIMIGTGMIGLAVLLRRRRAAK